MHDEARPRLIGKVFVDDQRVAIHAGGQSIYDVKISRGDACAVSAVLNDIDGTRTLGQIAACHGPDVHALINALHRHGLVVNERAASVRPARVVLCELEDVINQQLQILYHNRFWEALLDDKRPVPERVFHGMVVENYHFLFRESWFDSPVLGFQGSTRARALMNEFYVEEYGHDRLLLKALETLGVSEHDLSRTVPLPETMALCNALSYWARFDPMFFFATLGVLEGRDVLIDSFVLAAERRGLPAAFIAPVRAHSNINMNAGHGNMTRKIFSELKPIDAPEQARLERWVPCFVQLYDAFYCSIYDHYSRASTLLRRIEDFS